MNKKKLLYVLLALLGVVALLLGIGAATFSMPELVRVDGIEVLELEERDLKAQLKARIYNGNFYSLSASKLEYITTYRDTVIGRGKLREGLSLAGGDTTTVEMPMDLNLDAIFAVYKSMLRERKCKLDIHLEGSFTKLGIARGLDLEMEMAPDSFLQSVVGGSLGDGGVKLEEMQWKRGDLKGSDIAFVALVKNPIKVPLELRKMEMAFLPEDSRTDTAGRWWLEKAVTLQPDYTTRMPGTVHLLHLAAGKGIVESIFKGEIRYAAVGKVTLGLARLDFEVPLEGTVVIDPKDQKVRWE